MVRCRPFPRRRSRRGRNRTSWSAGRPFPLAKACRRRRAADRGRIWPRAVDGDDSSAPLTCQTLPTALLLSARTARDVLFSEELHSIESSDPAFLMALAITRERPARGLDYGRRIDGAMVQEILTRLDRMPTHVFVCGSNGFVNIATDAVLLAGVDASSVRTERYGG